MPSGHVVVGTVSNRPDSRRGCRHSRGPTQKGTAFLPAVSSNWASPGCVLHVSDYAGFGRCGPFWIFAGFGFAGSLNRPEILKMPRDIRTGGKTHQRNSIPAVKMTTGHHFRVVEDVHSQGLERGLMAPPALQSRWSPSPGPDLANVRVAENNRRIPIAERLSANAAHHFSFLRNCLRSAPEPLVYVNPCGPEALALISDQRGATNNPRRSAESQSRSSARAGRDGRLCRTIRPGAPKWVV